MRSLASYAPKTYSREIIRGYILETAPLATSSDKCIARILTFDHGKISCIYSQENAIQLFPLDEIEAVIKKNQQGSLYSSSKMDEKLHRPGLVTVTEYTKLSSSFEIIQLKYPQHQSTDESSIPLFNPYPLIKRKYLDIAAATLNKFLEDREPHNQSVNLLSTLLPLTAELRDIKIIPLLISLLFFEHEGVDFEEIRRIATASFSHELQEKVLKDISLLFFEKSSLLFTHQFSQETVDLVTGILGMSGRKPIKTKRQQIDK